MDEKMGRWEMRPSPFQDRLIRPAFGCILEQTRTSLGHHTQDFKKVGIASYTGALPIPQAPRCWQQLLERQTPVPAPVWPLHWPAGSHQPSLPKLTQLQRLGSAELCQAALWTFKRFVAGTF